MPTSSSALMRPQRCGRNDLGRWVDRPTAPRHDRRPLFRPFLQSGALNPAELNRCDQINLHEAIVVVLACNAVLNQWDSLSVDRPATPHIHGWCDNTSAIAWLTRYKNHHPLINLVLQPWSRLQCEHHVTLTLGHIPAAENTTLDAISHQFRVENGSATGASLSHMTPHVLPRHQRHDLPPSVSHHPLLTPC